jgi:long-subunit acyl-CoA synthetase (AMP-forming)
MSPDHKISLGYLNCIFPGEWKHALSITMPKLVMCSMSVCETKLEQYLESSNVKQVLVWDSKGKSLPQHATALEEFLDATPTAQLERREQRNICNGSTIIVTQDSEEKNVAGKKQTKNLPALILSSSGSTGLPKGVVLTHFNITAALTTRYVPLSGGQDSK